MPIYEYNCADCNKEVEILVRGNDKPNCPNCESEKLTKLLSVTAAPASKSELPVMPAGGGCGLPQCGQGRCMGME